MGEAVIARRGGGPPNLVIVGSAASSVPETIAATLALTDVSRKLYIFTSRYSGRRQAFTLENSVLTRIYSSQETGGMDLSYEPATKTLRVSDSDSSSFSSFLVAYIE